MDFFGRLESILFCKGIDSRYALFRDLYDDFLSKKVILNHSEIINNDFAFFTPCEIVKPTKIHRHHSIKSKESLAKILHSIAHIEFCAISLALDSAYRFRHLPIAYYNDWLEVADEEFKHFFLLQKLLSEIGFCYGDFKAHFGLYEAMSATGENLVYRMGVVHRGLEAKGLDANPFVRTKLLETKRAINPQIAKVLDIILRDEIGHVSKGNKWWEFAIMQNQTNQNVSCDYTKDFIAICEKFSEFVLAGKILNINARLASGFSKEECQDIDRFYKARFSK